MTILLASTFFIVGMPSTSSFTAETLLTATLFLTFLFFFFLLRLFIQTMRRSFQNHRLPPGPTTWPIFGSLLTMVRHKPHFRWILAIAEGKDITCIRLGGTHVIVVNSSELGCEFLKKYDANFASRPLTMATEYSSRRFHTIVVTPWGDQWKKMKRVVASEIINTTRFRWQSNLRTEEADHLVKYIYNQCRELEVPVINIRLVTRYFAGKIIRRMMFGVRHFGKGGEYDGPGMEELEHVEAAFTVLALIYSFSPSDFMPWLRWLDIDGHERMMKEAIGVINKYHDPIIEERIQKWRGEEREDSGDNTKVEDLLDIFISLKDNEGRPLLTIEEIKAQTAELVYASVDNPSNIAEWTMAELLNQPVILQKAMDELDRVVGKDRLVQESDFPQLPYLKACAREGLRLHPMAAFNLPHVSLADATVANYFIPKGSQVLLSRVGLGRNKEIWDNPLQFNPDRHLEDESIDVIGLAEPNLRLISFTVGRRGCMGSSLGSIITYMLLARLLQAFDWSLAPGEHGVDLSEEHTSFFMAGPFHACAKPRLSFLANL